MCIVVLGDIGRSPRMLNHATSLADSGYFVNIVGYIGMCSLCGVLPVLPLMTEGKSLSVVEG